MHRPRIILNFAMTVDGKVSTANKTPSGFTSEFDKRRLLEIRALGDALIAGRNTVAIDRMSMGLPNESLRKARTERGQSPYPLRVMISNSGDFPPDLEVFKHTFSPILIYSTSQMPACRQTELRAKTILHIGNGDVVRLPEVLNDLCETHRVRTLVCEGGPQLAKSLAELDCLDEIFLTIAPILAGGRDAPGILGPPGSFLPSSRTYQLESMKHEAGECYLHYVACKSPCTRPTR
ncbi:MAG TPA: dihydrofolate reductase family protein [Chthoniobacterales bacterium]